MFRFLKAYWKIVLAVGLVLGSSAYWNANTKAEADRRIDERIVVTVTAPIQSLVSGIVGGIKHVWYGYFYFVGLREANDGLRAENDRLRGELAADWETGAENERLREMLAFRKETPGELLAASVIAADAASFAKGLRIDRGSHHGVGRNMAVVTPSGVVGRVVEVGPFHSDVQLVTDGRSAVPVRVQRTRAQGVLQGLAGGICHLKYVARADDVEPGDVVITSGLGGIFPRGIVTGTVVSVEKREFGVLQEVRVAPAVDFRRLPEEVFVVVQVPEESLRPEPTPEETPASAAKGPAASTAARPPGPHDE